MLEEVYSAGREITWIHRRLELDRAEAAVALQFDCGSEQPLKGQIIPRGGSGGKGWISRTKSCKDALWQ